jgi:hypothetical protein
MHVPGVQVSRLNRLLLGNIAESCSDPASHAVELFLLRNMPSVSFISSWVVRRRQYGAGALTLHSSFQSQILCLVVFS